MNLDDPSVAQQVVADYVRRLELDNEAGQWPVNADVLPYSKSIIKAAIRTSLSSLGSSGHLTEELREFLEGAYVSLADYVTDDLVRLMNEYQQAGADLAADNRLAREKTNGLAWRTVSESGALVGEIARTIAGEAAALREEFREFASTE
jgi:hypothetical protein